jgi:hypothetical protein
MDQRWGRDIEPGAAVTTYGRHGAGQPAIIGEVVKIEHGEVVIDVAIQWVNGRPHAAKPGTIRRRSISNVRRNV